MQNYKTVENTILDGKVKNVSAYEKAKRFFDVLGALLALIIFSPIFLIVACIIKLDSKGPVIFKHRRLGQNGRPIDLYKFRTMVANAEELLQTLTPEQKKEFETNFKLEKDPRITRIGAFLRKSSLDELPQLLNILKGDMSVVGPRPIVERELEKYGECSDKFLSVIPGLTGYWQCNGRSTTTYEERVKMDMYYIDNRCLRLDLGIILKTVIVVFKKEGAV